MDKEESATLVSNVNSKILLEADVSKKVGNMKPVCWLGDSLLALGPDYCFFIPTFLFFISMGIFSVKTVFAASTNQYYRLATIIICLGHPISYLVTALSDPGIAREPDFVQNPECPAEPQTMKKYRWCEFCSFHVVRSTRHCTDCGLCIEGYDHHCPWVSKCIGRKNLIAFYIFLSLTPINFVYSMVSFFACMSIQLMSKRP